MDGDDDDVAVGEDGDDDTSDGDDDDDDFDDRDDDVDDADNCFYDGVVAIDDEAQGMLMPMTDAADARDAFAVSDSSGLE